MNGTGLGALAILGIAAAAARAGAEPADRVELSVVGTNDQHGYLEVPSGQGGAALLGGYLRALRARRPGRVLLVDGGDLFQGTLVSNTAEGAPVIRAMNALGYHAAAVGNHEFDFGPVGPAVVARPGENPRGALEARAKEARFPLLDVNVVVRASGKRWAPDNIRPYTIVKLDGVVVGIVGGTTEEAATTTLPLNVRDLEFQGLGGPIARAAMDARAAGAEIVVAVVHAGGVCRRIGDPHDLATCKPDEEVMRLARQVAGRVDAIVAGHTHKGMAHFVAGVPVIESFAFGVAFGRIDLVWDRKQKKLRASETIIHPPRRMKAGDDYEGATVVPDAAVRASYQADLDRTAALEKQPLGVTLSGPFWENHGNESPLGNLVADWTRALVPGADFALVNGGSLRANLAAGPLTYGALFRAQPFDNRAASVTVTGAALRRALALAAEHDMTYLVSGLRYRARCDKGKVVVDVTREDAKPWSDTARYRIAASDFLATGGAGMLSILGQPIQDDIRLYSERPAMRDEFVALLRKTPGAVLDPARWYDPKKLRADVPEGAMKCE